MDHTFSEQIKGHWSLVLIVLSLPCLLWGISGILPTFDDYTTLQSTWYIQISDPGYFFPDSIRRPWDFLFGCLLGFFPALFPTLNHIVIILGHAASALLVYALCRRLQMRGWATHIATLYFFFSPATLGATLACDGLNQTYAQFFGLLSLWFYLKQRKGLWILFIVMAVLSKENGLAWAIVPPIIAYGFQLTDRRTALRHVGIGLLVALIYFIVFFIIYHSGLFGIQYDEQYSQNTLASHLKDFVQLMAYTWVPLDYMSAVYPPTRNWTIVIITALMTLPFLMLLGRRWSLLKQRQLLSLVACFFILVSPHLITLVSIMHNYAALSVAALIIAYIVSYLPENRLLVVAFVLYMAAALFTDIRHYVAARESGELSREMAMEVINSTDTPTEKVLCISIDDEAEPRYSNFCVRPVDAFAWGLSVRHFSHYTWKTQITTISLPHYDQQQIESKADSALQNGYQAVWIAGHDHHHVKIITP